jgi:hypothetical protein
MPICSNGNKSYGRQDKLADHLRSHPGIINLSQTAAAGKNTVNSKCLDKYKYLLLTKYLMILLDF